MRICVWNVNSARTRLDRMVEMLRRNDIDVLAVQETKCRDDQFPTAAFEELGYQVAHHGLNQWNGVAIISRVGLEDIQAGFPGQPGFNKDPDATPTLEARHIAATCGGVRIHSLYIPNGRDITDLHFEYKLEFLERLRQHIIATLDDDPEATFMMGGDFNIAPTDGDVWSMAAFAGKTHVTPPERAAFYALEQAGMKEVTRQFTPNQWTYWDYKAGRFFKDEGMRIDFQLASPALAAKASAGFIDIEERQGKGASDHAPVIVDYEV
ncbi:exodeoxyribonuclease III [Corynebacterium amycolatum]|uniref:exodeoxyribonuclease III n=1 Tax=Corynebacterium amycolatum TaxID=43765 RepID=UPI001244E21C|nr:exodeoxyribonuclease III [Corynebacterium amycolatum]KAA9225944.1 exodeoxyribonuclease III [Corynebacterium amycolatum]MCG7269303.1 exodeoxyribonuclease III [Corynebacterium amycolatum]